MKLAHKNVCVHVGVGFCAHASTHMEEVKSIYLSIHPTMALNYLQYAYLFLYLHSKIFFTAIAVYGQT